MYKSLETDTTRTRSKALRLDDLNTTYKKNFTRNLANSTIDKNKYQQYNPKTLCSLFRSEIEKGKTIIREEFDYTKERLDKFCKKSDNKNNEELDKVAIKEKLNKKMNLQAKSFLLNSNKLELELPSIRLKSLFVNKENLSIFNRKSQEGEITERSETKINEFYKELEKKKLQDNNKNSYNRRKTYEIDYIDNWYVKNNFMPTKINSNLTNNIEFQSNILIDQIKVLMDNILHFRTKFLNDRILIHVFRNLNMNKKIKMNKVLEETCGLILRISNGILIDFSKFLEKFVAIQPPNPEKIQTKIIEDEEITFKENCNLLVEISIFLKSCYEVYTTLTKQVDDMNLNRRSLIEILQFLDRARLNVSTLICSTHNYRENYKKDINLYHKYRQTICKLYGEKDEEEKLKDEEKEFKKFIEIKKQKTPYEVKINEENERAKRLNKVLYV
jgi:hypothetical protein